ncbi:hypothetical protein P0Y35_11800 [Kiritimatiellaeota bacterium B1221]|nr:hypothetical protein [Kiritimatiellaeota bacterium B1221]
MDLERKSDKVTILGFGQTALERKHNILDYCKDGEIWTLNTAYRFYPHILTNIDRYFELHSYDFLKEEMELHKDPNRFKILDALDIPIYVSETLPLIKKQVTYSYDKVFKQLGTNSFNGSPCLMLMLAICMGYKEINSYGIDQLDKQHEDQRGAWSFLLGLAHAKGIKIGGTANYFLLAKENDVGLRGIREDYGERIVNNT